MRETILSLDRVSKSAGLAKRRSLCIAAELTVDVSVPADVVLT